MKFRAVLVDDEERAIISLQKLIERHCDHIEVIGAANNIQNAKDMIIKSMPDVVFLDIAMPGGNGFQLLESFVSPAFAVVFVTAFNEFAIKAFQFSALHYLLKPINYLDLIETEKRLLQNHPDAQKERLDAFTHNHRNENKKIILSNQDSIYSLYIREILYIESVKNYLIFYCKSGDEIVITNSLSYYEELLSEYDFYRINRCYLVNMHQIQTYAKGRGGSIELKNGKKLEVSVRRKAEFLETFKVFHQNL